ncbi:insulin-like growth factor-binding protein complex acid labile subunit [Pollicipes pollicipes]|uniref:insulin-like growth factor-binding protein complex acid labile subunit n=1 Tax=Pollicipes pollicipes TaxID=41117 RepID=UPI001885890D|nr:insulin-like growth factor-binding protein complex acid labile subunit [Pollicipes pollicipes]
MSSPDVVRAALVTLAIICDLAAALCPEQCRCRPSTSDCSHSRLDAVPISLDPRVHILRLQGNRIGSIEDTLGFYQSLRELNLADNSLTSLGEGQLVMQEELKQLRLEDNLLSVLLPDSFKGLRRLLRLDLSGNRLTVLDRPVFRWMLKLKTLNLGGNRIRTVARNAFENLGELVTLDLSHNRLTHLPSESFRHLARLRTLALNGNRLQAVPFHAFFELRSLHSLSLAENSIDSVHAEAFAYLYELRALNVSYNRLETFPAASLALPQLEKLDASGNHFSSLKPRHLDNLHRLRVFRLCQSQLLSSVTGHIFSNNLLLEEVHLCMNPQLRWFPRTAVDSLPHLKVLNLGGNSLGTLENITSLLQRIEAFNVSGNPLVCNCSARWLWDLPAHLPNTSVLFPIRCVDSGRLLTELSEADLGCGWWLTAAIAAAAVAFVAAFCAALTRPMLMPAGSGLGHDSPMRGRHFTLLTGDYAGTRDAGCGWEHGRRCDRDFGQHYAAQRIGDYAARAPSLVV